jgi:hypothetical protein
MTVAFTRGPEAAGRRSDAAPALSLALGPLGGREDKGRDDPLYFLVVGFLALGWQHED